MFSIAEIFSGPYYSIQNQQRKSLLKKIKLSLVSILSRFRLICAQLGVEKSRTSGFVEAQARRESLSERAAPISPSRPRHRHGIFAALLRSPRLATATSKASGESNERASASVSLPRPASREPDDTLTLRTRAPLPLLLKCFSILFRPLGALFRHYHRFGLTSLGPRCTLSDADGHASPVVRFPRSRYIMSSSNTQCRTKLVLNEAAPLRLQENSSQRSTIHRALMH